MDERHRRFVELNVQESCINLFTNPVVQRKQAKDSIPKIHGLVYDMATGFLNKLDINFKVCVRIMCVCVCERSCFLYFQLLLLWLINRDYH